MYFNTCLIKAYLSHQSISVSGDISVDGYKEEGTKHRRLMLNGNDTPRSVHEDASTISPHDIANDDWEDDSVADGAGRDGVWGICEEAWAA